MKEEIKTILGKHKVIGDTTYGLGYAEADQLVNEIIALFSKRADLIFQGRKNELEKVSYHDKSRAFVVSGIDLIYNYKQEVFDNLTP